MKKMVFFVAILLYFSASPTDAQTIKTWCVSQNHPPDDKKQRFLDFVCGQKNLDCRPINPGGQCFQPNTLFSHTNYALSLYYRSTGVCNREIGQIVFTNPSSSTCQCP